MTTRSAGDWMGPGGALVLKHRQSRAVRCRAIPQNAALDGAATETVVHGIRYFGIAGSAVPKSDNEAADSARCPRAQAMQL